MTDNVTASVLLQAVLAYVVKGLYHNDTAVHKPTY